MNHKCLLTIVSVAACMIAGCDSSTTSHPVQYDSSSPYAPSSQTQRDIDAMSGTAADKASAKDAVRRFNEAAAARGEKPTGL